MPRARGLSCLMSPLNGKRPSGDARSSAACICCIGPHHKPSSVSRGGGCVPCLAPHADHSVRAPLTSCCGSRGGDNLRGRSSSARTPKTPCTPTARRLCGVHSRTPRCGQVGCFPSSSAPAAAAAARTPRTPTTPIGRTQRACCARGPAQGNAKLGRRRRWLRSTGKTPRRTARAGGDVGNGDVKVYTTGLVEAAEEAGTKEEETSSNEEYALLCRQGFPREDVAAVTIQAYFRGHLARRAFKALKSLVRLQAVARGAYVRRQAEAAIHCMQAMVRLQMRVRARQMLTKPKDGQLLPS
ncbi:hypothetical protein E2562_023925 [Oryza meyeriana var. granulata]|uniref:DUF4005 domain-containing protein n=1 Tax=Oryza meyeriana var. granulata TaxID=110450 RepID=A0A6G1C080_9ORYZ|nr:hypothetical protein E2562_023925 [Oryza meyeriana var. granulata]